MLSSICCLLLVVCRAFLFVVGRLLLCGVCCSLIARGSVVVCCLVFVACGLLSVDCCLLLLGVCWLLFVVSSAFCY